jgi:hypothetical protein
MQIVQFGPPVAAIARQVPESIYPKADFRNVSPMPRPQQRVADKSLPVLPAYPLKRSIYRMSCGRRVRPTKKYGTEWGEREFASHD